MAPSYTTLVNVDADIAKKLAAFIGLKISSEEYVTECEKLIEASQTQELVAKFLEKHEVLLDLETDADVESALQSLFSVMYLVGEGNQEGPSVKAIVAALTANKEQFAKRRLSALVALFNLANDVSSKIEVLSAIFNYSLATSQVALVAQLAARVDEWAAAWGLSAAQHRSLLLLLSKVLATESQNNQRLQATVKYLQTFKGQTLDAEALGVLSSGLADAIRSPLEAFNDRVTLYEAVATANATGDAVKLLALLKILCDGGLAEFATFQSSNSALLAAHKLSADDLEHKLRILTLCSVAAQVSPKRELTFAELSAALKVDAAEVELWVVEAIAAGLLEASIDQLQSTVTINRYTYRSFGSNDWKALQSGLKDLSKQVNGVLSSLQAKAL